MISHQRRWGLIEISSATALSYEIPRGMPADVLTLVTRLRLPNLEVSVRAMTAMLETDALETAARQLADARVSLIVLGCTTASLFDGIASDQRVVDRIEAATGVPAVTTAGSVVANLRHLGVETLAVGTPYPGSVNEAERVFLEECGFRVVGMEGLGLATSPEIGAVTEQEVAALARRVAATPSDAVFLSCTNLRTLAVLDELTRELGRPVVSSNSATFWDARRRLTADQGVTPGQVDTGA